MTNATAERAQQLDRLERAMARAGVMPRDITGAPITIRAAAAKIIAELAWIEQDAQAHG